MERSKAQCIETGPVSSRMFQRLAARPFRFAVMVIPLEGEELMLERSRHIEFAADPVCECLRKAYIDQT